jgi:nucleoside-diphosphate-sugar epimerase
MILRFAQDRFVIGDLRNPIVVEEVIDQPFDEVYQLAEYVMEIAGKKLNVKHIEGPLGVRGRNSDNRLIAEKLGWVPSKPLKDGLTKTL